MSIVKCENSHYYDDVKYDKCPHCAMSEKSDRSNDNELTVAKISATNKRSKLASFVVGTEEKTIGKYTVKGSFVPVVGWLVCVEGAEKGRDYRIVSGQNFVGRSHSMDITIADDPEISRERHCSIIYDPKSCRFSFVPGPSLSYCNGDAVNTPVGLNAYDKITIGSTVLQFIPFCRKGDCWQ